MKIIVSIIIVVITLMTGTPRKLPKTPWNCPGANTGRNNYIEIDY
ncbi:MAG: hypothetical protein R2883_01590 [Caldisericia bacterium]